MAKHEVDVVKRLWWRHVPIEELLERAAIMHPDDISNSIADMSEEIRDLNVEANKIQVAIAFVKRQRDQLSGMAREDHESRRVEKEAWRQEARELCDGIDEQLRRGDAAGALKKMMPLFRKQWKLDE